MHLGDDQTAKLAELLSATDPRGPGTGDGWEHIRSGRIDPTLVFADLGSDGRIDVAAYLVEGRLATRRRRDLPDERWREAHALVVRELVATCRERGRRVTAMSSPWSEPVVEAHFRAAGLVPVEIAVAIVRAPSGDAASVPAPRRSFTVADPDAVRARYPGLPPDRGPRYETLAREADGAALVVTFAKRNRLLPPSQRPRLHASFAASWGDADALIDTVLEGLRASASELGIPALALYARDAAGLLARRRHPLVAGLSIEAEDSSTAWELPLTRAR